MKAAEFSEWLAEVRKDLAPSEIAEATATLLGELYGQIESLKDQVSELREEVNILSNR